MSDHDLGPDPPAHPQLGERVLQREQRWLSGSGLNELVGRAVSVGFRREKNTPQIATHMRLEQTTTAVEFPSNKWFVRVESGPHVHVLRALTSEHERHGSVLL